MKVGGHGEGGSSIQDGRNTSVEGLRLFDLNEMHKKISSDLVAE